MNLGVFLISGSINIGEIVRERVHFMKLTI